MAACRAERLPADVTRATWTLHRVLGQTRRPPENSTLLPPAQIELLLLIEAQPGLSVREAADALTMQPNNVSTLVSRLVRRGLIDRVPDPADRRHAQLHPTKKMLEAGRQVNSGLYSEVARALANLPPEAGERIAAAVPELFRLADELTRLNEQR